MFNVEYGTPTSRDAVFLIFASLVGLGIKFAQVLGDKKRAGSKNSQSLILNDFCDFTRYLAFGCSRVVWTFFTFYSRKVVKISAFAFKRNS